MMLSRGGNLYAGAITGLPVSDMTGGFNAIRTSQLKRLDFEINLKRIYLQLDRFEFDLNVRG